MSEMLHALGRQIARLFGEPSTGHVYAGEGAEACRETAFGGETLASVLPFEAYDERSGIFLGQKSLGFAIEAVPLVGGDDDVQNQMVGLLEETMEEGSSLQALLWADHRTEPFVQRWAAARKGRADVYAELAEQRGNFLMDSSRNSTRIFRFILSYSVPVESHVTPDRLRDVEETRDRILKGLQSLTFAFSWGAEEFLTAVGGMLNFERSSKVRSRVWNPYESLANQATAGGILKVEEDRLEWGASAVSFRSFRVVDYPSNWSLSSMQYLIGDAVRDAFRVTAPFFLHYGIHIPPQGKVEAGFRRKTQLIENQGKSSMLRRLIPELEEELQECDYVRRSIKQGARFVWSHLGAGLWAPVDELPKQEQSLKSLFRIHQFGLAANTCLHFPAFLSTLPMAWAEYAKDLRYLGLLKTTISKECSSFLPLHGEWMGTPSPGLLLMGRRGQLLNWNPFDNQSGNYNVVVVGRSGSGKSVFMQDLLLSGLGTGSKVYVIEVGRSFEKMCSSLQGQHIQFSAQTDICLNPFSRISEDSEEERLASLTLLKSIVSAMASPTEGTSDFENALIEKAISQAWASRGTQATITDIAEYLQSQQDPRAKTLGTMLTPYCRGGVYAKYFEGTNNVDFKSQMVLIELEELKEKKDLQCVVLQLFLMSITTEAFLGDRKTPFYICIDEAWDLLRGKHTGLFIETMARRLRKYHGSLVIGTQSVDDFFSTPGALAAFENSDWMCFLAQKKSSVARLAQSGKVNMSQSMRLALESVTTSHGEFSEVMICDADGNYAIARLRLDPFSQLLYTTKAQEYSDIKDLQQQGLSIVDAINRLIQRNAKSDAMAK